MSTFSASTGMSSGPPALPFWALRLLSGFLLPPEAQYRQSRQVVASWMDRWPLDPYFGSVQNLLELFYPSFSLSFFSDNRGPILSFMGLSGLLHIQHNFLMLAWTALMLPRWAASSTSTARHWRQRGVSFFCLCYCIIYKAVILRWIHRCQTLLHYLFQEYIK